MNRVGKGGAIIGVYKMRTMHPYSEFLQDYIYQLNSRGRRQDCQRVPNQHPRQVVSKVLD